MGPGGRAKLSSVFIAAASSCLMGASASGGEVASCAASEQGLSFNTEAPGKSRCSNGNALELKAEASDRGAYWSEGDDQRRTTRLSLTSEPELNYAIAFRASGLEMPFSTLFGTLEVHGGVGRARTSDALTFDRLLWTDKWYQDNTAMGVGVVERMFAGRLMVSTDLSWSNGTSRWRDSIDPNALELSELSGAARWHKFEAKLVDSADFKWALTGELSVVEDGYTGNAAARPLGLIAMRGETTKLSTQLSAYGATAYASAEHIANRLFDRTMERVRVDLDGVEATLYSKSIDRFAPADASRWTGRKSVQGVSFDITPQLLAPEMLGPSALVPQLVSLSWESGSVAYPSGPASADQVVNFEVLASWKTSLGTTTALFSSERQGREVIGLGYVGDKGQIIDLSHAVKVGNWQLSAAASVTSFQNSSPQDSFADDAVSGRFSLRYAPEHGPNLEASLGRVHDEFAIDTEDFVQRLQATTLSVTLDLSDYVQRRLDRPDMRLKIDYRHQLKQQEIAQDMLAPDERMLNTDTLLTTFAAPL